MSTEKKLQSSLKTFSNFIALVDIDVSYNMENLWNGSLWFSLLSKQQVSHLLEIATIHLSSKLRGFVSKIPTKELSSDRTRQARTGRWENLTSLYRQMMFHYENNLVKPTVEFCVPDLVAIAQKDTDNNGIQAIVWMNALILGVYTHSPDGLTQFRRLTEADESTLESDMIYVGAGAPASLNKNDYTEYVLFHVQAHILVIQHQFREEHYYYLRSQYYGYITQLQHDAEDAKVSLEMVQGELENIRESFTNNQLKTELQERKLQAQIVQITEEQEECNTKIANFEAQQDDEQLKYDQLHDKYLVTAMLLKNMDLTSKTSNQKLVELEAELDKQKELLDQTYSFQLDPSWDLTPKQEKLISQDNTMKQSQEQGITNEKYIELEHDNLKGQHELDLAAKQKLVGEAMKKDSTIMDLCQEVKRLGADLDKAVHDINIQVEVQGQKDIEIKELEAQLMNNPVEFPSSSFAEESKIAELREDQNQWKIELATEQQRSIISHQLQRDQANLKYSHVEGRVADLEKTLKAVKTRNFNMKETLEKVEIAWNVQKEHTALQKQKDKAETEKNELRSRLNEIQVYLAEIEERRDQADQDLMNLQHERRELQEKISSLEAKNTFARDALKREKIQRATNEARVSHQYYLPHKSDIETTESLANTI
ncbi:hypothetical protein K438DRAFT_2119108 [Mycena galopus ATCC 62051]|nr:hypothetical protein K438DRAFT_2119108 [Mycena galopus ATCC 62051]